MAPKQASRARVGKSGIEDAAANASKAVRPLNEPNVGTTRLLPPPNSPALAETEMVGSSGRIRSWR